MTDFTGTQLATILSALDGQTRNPASKAAALAAIRRHADQLGCTVEDILEAAAGLLDGRMSADDFRAALRDEGATDEPSDDAATGPPPNRTKTRPGRDGCPGGRTGRERDERQPEAAVARRLPGGRALAASRTGQAGRNPAR